jgi:predicted RNase H-like HicB family nuclease
MLARYIRSAMEKAVYEILEDDGSYYGHIPGIEGVWANAPSLEACRDELAEVLEEWLLLSIADHSPLPEMGGIRLEVREVA